MLSQLCRSVAFGVALLVTLPFAQAQSLPYLFDRLKSPAYRKPLEALFAKKVTRFPAWIGVFLKDGNGVAAPGISIVADGQSFELYSVCEPHNCGGKFVYGLYTPNGG